MHMQFSRRKPIRFRIVVGIILLLVLVLTLSLAFFSGDFSDDGLKGQSTGDVDNEGRNVKCLSFVLIFEFLIPLPSLNLA